MKCKCKGTPPTPIITPLKSLKSKKFDFEETYCPACGTKSVSPIKKSAGPFPVKDVGIF